MSNTQEMIVVGRLGSAYGIRGWLKVNAFTDSLEGIFEYSPWRILVQGQWQEVKVADWRRHNNGIICRLAEVQDRNQAEQYINCDIAILPEQLQSLPEDEFYWRDLVGCTVVNTKGYDMGKVTGLLETGSNDVLEVEAKSNDAFGKRERLIPFVTEQFILEVDAPGKKIVVDWDPSF
ncbi:ribosome maturation factor RimM [Ferrimonas balearica]|uniref:ribosome maturation factor RimM n=1 Tax=Ferrimonas balearica TaxID=44012 RepID=UPI001C9924A2|nr:ribosome maturation factor RimM [Ferrimonas balearica]MBY5993476.1 ribosome maturation factor RimM [Ferrimonas balearica]